MTIDQHSELLKLIWKLGGPTHFITTDGKEVEVTGKGEFDEVSGRYYGAEICIDGIRRSGDIVIWAGKIPPIDNYESTILHVTPESTAFIIRNDGNTVPQVEAAADPLCRLALTTLTEGSRYAGCGRYIARIDTVQRVSLFTRLLADRLHRKCGDVMETYRSCEENWNETLYIKLYEYLGGDRNRKAYHMLARKVGYHAVSRERSSVKYAEALLLGTSGLLEFYDDDDYIRELKSEFSHLSRKLSITPIPAGMWDLTNTYPANHPVIRLAQLAMFLTKREFIFDNMLKCRTVEDIQAFFNVTASEYWSSHTLPAVKGEYRPKSIGAAKANVMGINITVPIMFAYSSMTGNEELKQAALHLLEKIGAEKNKKIESWMEKGVFMESAFDTQAILQLQNEYCEKAACCKCIIGKRVVSDAFLGQSAQKM